MRVTNVEALQAQGALSKLLELDLPVLVSVDVALVSNLVDKQVGVFSRVRDKLFKDYSIKTEPGETEGSIKFSCTAKGENEEETKKLQSGNLETFGDKFNALLEAKTEDLDFRKIKLPKEIDGKPMLVKSSILKSLTEFVEVE